MLTKQDLAAIRAADDMCVHLNAHRPDGHVRLIKRRDPNKPFSEDQEYILTAKARLYGMRGQQELKDGLVECFAMCGLYHWQHSHVSCVLKTLRVGDELGFEFYPDAHTNGYLAMHGLHGDTLYLSVRRAGKTVAHWEVAKSTCPANSARLVRGVPNSDDYHRQAEDARNVA